MNENQKNPAEYGYAGEEQVAFTVPEYTNTLKVIDSMLDKETLKFTPLKYKYINRETREEIKKVTEKNKHLASKVVDIEKTLSSEPTLFLSQEGLNLLRQKMMLQGVHIANIESGVAKHYTELEELAKEEQAKAQEFLAQKDAANAVETEAEPQLDVPSEE